ncbi:glucan phosphoethanolaminetransferase (alkaline phosphatase superfamily) [Algoriphagus iocasae]|jgi:glucan phosphoethanolaminetransferase (alkaline phosphatase superfamily)|uniref:Glucan phosphoethanolaminetransferase (Alkaline phosphatase superfamily) n=1 Tax=Algoriphagus iocasae TaxID=1836499 RepID=A0A841MW76_9BACT|nr:phage holin family protein [Algoriphagus iocasae]MBB6326745.1 glucan phosphoethanolaminetransferase (alkaline phosphatase superfamily) [Algoriphagus iocasae]
MLKIGEIVQTVKGIVETKLDIVKLEIQEEFLGIVSRILLLLFMCAVFLLVLLFFSFSLAFFLSQYTNSPYLGFLLVGLIYLTVLAFLYYTRYSNTFQKNVQEGLKVFIFNARKIKKKEDEPGA